MPGYSEKVANVVHGAEDSMSGHGVTTRNSVIHESKNLGTDYMLSHMPPALAVGTLGILGLNRVSPTFERLPNRAKFATLGVVATGVCHIFAARKMHDHMVSMQGGHIVKGTVAPTVEQMIEQYKKPYIAGVVGAWGAAAVYNYRTMPLTTTGKAILTRVSAQGAGILGLGGLLMGAMYTHGVRGISSKYSEIGKDHVHIPSSRV
eukprot:178852_1